MGSCRRRDLLGYVRSRTGSGPPARGPAPGLAGRTRACPHAHSHQWDGTLRPGDLERLSRQRGAAGRPGLRHGDDGAAPGRRPAGRHRGPGRCRARGPRARPAAARRAAGPDRKLGTWRRPGQELAALVEQFGMDRWRLPAERRFALECIVVGTVAFVWLGFLVWGLGGQRVTQAISHPSRHPQDRPVVRGAPPRRPARGHRDRRRQRLTASRSRPARASRRVRR
jgi:hypothetical protein